MEHRPETLYQEESIDIKKFLFKILSHWYWFAISLFIALSAAYLVNRYSEPVYSVSATVIVRDDAKGKGLTGAENVIEGMEIFTSRMNVMNEMGILQSYTLAKQAIDSLKDFEISYVLVGRRKIAEAKLYNNSPFTVNYDTAYAQLRGYPVDITILSNEEYRLQIDENINFDQTLKFGEQFVHESFNFNITLRDPENFDFESWTSLTFYFIINK